MKVDVTLKKSSAFDITNLAKTPNCTSQTPVKLIITEKKFRKQNKNELAFEVNLYRSCQFIRLKSSSPLHKMKTILRNTNQSAPQDEDNSKEYKVKSSIFKIRSWSFPQKKIEKKSKVMFYTPGKLWAGSS